MGNEDEPKEWDYDERFDLVIPKEQEQKPGSFGDMFYAFKLFIRDWFFGPYYIFGWAVSFAITVILYFLFFSVSIEGTQDRDEENTRVVPFIEEHEKK